MVSFAHSGPIVPQIAALTEWELRLVCDILGVVQASSMRKEGLVNVVAKKVCRLISEKEVHGECSQETHLNDSPIVVTQPQQVSVSKPDPEPSGDSESNLRRLELTIKLEETQPRKTEAEVEKTINLEEIRPRKAESEVEKMLMEVQLATINTTSNAPNAIESSHLPIHFQSWMLIPISPHFKGWLNRWVGPINFGQFWYNKPLQVFASLSDTDAEVYEIIKKEVLKAYDLVSEVYRLHLRNMRKKSDQTHLEFARCRVTRCRDGCVLKRYMILTRCLNLF